MTVPSFRTLLPSSVALAEHAGIVDIDAFAPLYDDERADADRMVLRRRQEFVAGRALARQALVALGALPCSIPRRPDRSPLWPAGICGSITHCDGLVASAVAPAGDIRALGIDAERISRVDPEILSHIGNDAEVNRARHLSGVALQLHVAVLFSAKECVQKAWGSRLSLILPFGAVEADGVIQSPGQVRLTVRDRRIQEAHGAETIAVRWMRTEDFILVALCDDGP